MTKRKFYRAKVTIDILSAEPFKFDFSDGNGQTNPELNQISEGITSGHWSGNIDTKIMAPISGKKMAKLLKEQGSDPGFFSLTANGEDTE
jgi:hypothetical protein